MTAPHETAPENVGWARIAWIRPLTCSDRSWTKDHVTQNRRLAAALLATVPHFLHAEVMDPLAARICLELPEHVAAPGVLLAWSKARWSELIKISIAEVNHRASVHIHATKHSADRWLLPRPAGCPTLWALVSDAAPIHVVAYQEVSRQIRDAAARLNIVLPPQCKKGTHIFRHLWGSWLLSRGWSAGDIGRWLGHKYPTSTKQYLHTLEAHSESRAEQAG
jgi:integrase